MLTFFQALFLGAVTSLLIFLVGGFSRNAILFAVLIRIVTLLGIRTTISITVPALSIFLAARYLSDTPKAPAQVQYASPKPASSPLRPLIFPSKTTHTRLVPKIHSFGYSYLLIGIPIGWQGHNDILGLDEGGRRPWFSIRAADYLSRDSQSSLREKLAAYLSSQGSKLDHYAHVYLVTAPRFLGYAFNPVSFWYLFSDHLRLEAMILEVNNTFDERRMYFMRRDLDASIDSEVEEPKFTHTWAKDFHVSPFNSRNGDYSLASVNPFASVKHDQPHIDNVITLISNGQTTLVARIFSTSSAVDPANMTTKDTAILLLHWFWVGFLTFPRILFQAGRLYFQRKLNVWYRPEVLRTSIGRQPNAHERVIEPIFLAFLESQVQKSPTNMSWKYTPSSGLPSDVRYFSSETGASPMAAPRQRIMRVLSPQFYTWITTEPNPARTISWYLHRSPNNQALKTYQTTAQKSLILLLTTYHPTQNRMVAPGTLLRAKILFRLRRLFKGNRGPHAIDRWVLETEKLTTEDKNKYFQSATAIQLVEEAAGGLYPLLDLLMLGLQSWFVWEMSGLLVQVDNWIVFGGMIKYLFVLIGTNDGSIIV